MALVTESVVLAEKGSGSEPQSPVSWAAIIGGAVTAVAITLLLVALGSGIGLSSVSPWSSANPSATTFTVLAAVWLLLCNGCLPDSAAATWPAGRERSGWGFIRTRR